MSERKLISVFVVNMHGVNNSMQTLTFSDYDKLRKDLAALLEELNYEKPNIELDPDWDVTDEERAMLDYIEIEAALPPQ